jgi:hypothetical protein
MINHRLHVYIKFMLGFVAMFAFVQAQGQIPDDRELGPFDELVGIDVGVDDKIVCTAAEYGAALLEGEDNDPETLPEIGLVQEFVIDQPLWIKIYRLVEDGLPLKIAEASFSVDAMATNGHDSVEVVPLPSDQIVTLNNDMGGTEFLLLANSFAGEYVDIDCTVFYPEYTEEYYLDTTGQVAMTVKKKVNKANKRKVNRKKAKAKRAARKKAWSR